MQDHLHAKCIGWFCAIEMSRLDGCLILVRLCTKQAPKYYEDGLHATSYSGVPLLVEVLLSLMFIDILRPFQLAASRIIRSTIMKTSVVLPSPDTFECLPTFCYNLYKLSQSFYVSMEVLLNLAIGYLDRVLPSPILSNNQSRIVAARCTSGDI